MLSGASILRVASSSGTRAVVARAEASTRAPPTMTTTTGAAARFFFSTRLSSSDAVFGARRFPPSRFCLGSIFTSSIVPILPSIRYSTFPGQTFRPTQQLRLKRSNQRRTYLFLPDSLQGLSKYLRDLFFNSSARRHEARQLRVKLRIRWNDDLRDLLLHQRNRMKESGVRHVREYAERYRAAMKHGRETVRLRRQGMQQKYLAKARRRMQRIKYRFADDRSAYRGAYRNAHRTSYRDAYRDVRASLRERFPLTDAAITRATDKAGSRRKHWGGRWIAHVNAKRRVLSAVRQRRRQRSAIMPFLPKYVDSLSPSAPFPSAPPRFLAPASSLVHWMPLTLTEPARASWFDEEGYPLTSRDPGTGRFVNPWLSDSTNGEHGVRNFLRWKLGKYLPRWIFDDNGDVKDGNGGDCDPKCSNSFSSSSNDSIGGEIHRPDHTTIALSSPTEEKEELDDNANDDRRERVKLTWLGHSTTLVSMPGGFTILTDPHLSNYAFHKKRYDGGPAVKVGDLPDLIDAVLISHDHYDHLDYWSVLDLVESGKVGYWIVPLGIKSWLIEKAGVSAESVVELEWWEGVRLSKKECGAVGGGEKKQRGFARPRMEGLVRAFDRESPRRQIMPEEGISRIRDPSRHDMVVTCAPAQHWCSRTPFDRNRRLWCSFAVRTTPVSAVDSDADANNATNANSTHSFYFAGDTARPPEFPLHLQIGDRLGPFDLAAVPIGAYAPSFFMSNSHCSPDEAVQIHVAVRARRSVAVHHRTFDLADEPRDEPAWLLRAEVERLNGEIETAMAAAGGVEGGCGDYKNAVSATNFAKNAAGENLGFLPSLIDFAIIGRGESIESAPRSPPLKRAMSESMGEYGRNGGGGFEEKKIPLARMLRKRKARATRTPITMNSSPCRGTDRHTL